MPMNRRTLFHTLIRVGALAMVAAVSLGAQTTPKVYFACYVPLTGTVYRVNELDVKPACTSATHVPFSWTDGASAVRVTDPFHGDVGGTYPNLLVTGLQGAPIIANPPISGQLLGFNGTGWTPVPAPSGGVTSHAALTGLGNDDHTQYLLANGTRSSIDGFAVTGTLGVGALTGPGPDVRMMWYPRKAAFRAGQQPVGSLGWVDANIGPYSVALGHSTTANEYYSTAMGHGTKANGLSATAMGDGTLAGGWYSTAMGQSTTANGIASTAMGVNTIASGHYSTAIGQDAVASGSWSLAMGSFTIASGERSTAMGQGASTNGKVGSFVYGDVSTDQQVTNTADGQFTVRAAGGFQFRTSPNLSTGCNLPGGSGTWVCTSSRFAKERFENLNGEDVLTKIGRMPIQTWSYRTEPGNVRHVGPTAQDFRAAFGLGSSDEAIALVDIDGINLLGVQALTRRTQSLERENAELRARLDRLEQILRTAGDIRKP